MKRYSEFYNLKLVVSPTQVDTQTTQPLPDFPSKKLLSMSYRVIGIRRELLETWLIAVMQQEQLLPSVFKFLDLSMSRMSFVMNMLNSASTPVDDAIVLDLAAQLSSEARQKLKALEHFDKIFFEQRRKLSETSLQTVFAHLLPLCADLMVGAKSIYIVSKLISPQHNRGYEMFLHYFVRENFELLGTMDLHKHICQEFPGDTAQYAFEILKVLQEYFERSCQPHSLHTVLGYSVRAYETFNSRKDGELDIKNFPQHLTSSDWIELTDEQFPDIKFKYKKEHDNSYLQGSMIVNCTVDTLLKHLTDLENRRKWDLFFEGGKVLQKSSDLEQVTLFKYNFELGKVCFVLKCAVRLFSAASVNFSLESVASPGTVLPPGYDLGTDFKSLYSIEAVQELKPLIESTMSTVAAMSDYELECSESAACYDSDAAELPRCRMTYEFEQLNNSLAFITAALEGRTILLSWSRLKALVENQELLGSKGSISHDTVQDMVNRKQLGAQGPLNRY